MSMAIFNSYVSLPEGNTEGVNMAQEILNSACFFHWKIDSTMSDVSNRDWEGEMLRNYEAKRQIENVTHRIHGAGIYANIKGVYWWDPCYHM